MARRNSPSVNAIRYFLCLVGILMLLDSGPADNPVAVAFVVVGFPYFLFGLLFRLFCLPFRFVVWLLRLFGILRPKPPPLPQRPPPLPQEWGDDLDPSEEEIDEFYPDDIEDDDDDDEWGSEPATYRQLGFIRHLGGNPPEGLTKIEASEMIDALLAQKRAMT